MQRASFLRVRSLAGSATSARRGSRKPSGDGRQRTRTVESRRKGVLLLLEAWRGVELLGAARADAVGFARRLGGFAARGGLGGTGRGGVEVPGKEGGEAPLPRPIPAVMLPRLRWSWRHRSVCVGVAALGAWGGGGGGSSGRN